MNSTAATAAAAMTIFFATSHHISHKPPHKPPLWRTTAEVTTIDAALGRWAKHLPWGTALRRRRTPTSLRCLAGRTQLRKLAQQAPIRAAIRQGCVALPPREGEGRWSAAHPLLLSLIIA
eukprot:41760-Chlamydomonas_euryale.AAC.3